MPGGWDESAGEIIPPTLKGLPRAQPHGPCREARRRETRRRPYCTPITTSYFSVN